MKDPLTIYYEGYWQCRQATDPDPSRDPRGASGYTYALGTESDFDQIIRLQRDEIPDHDFRKSWPAPYYPPSHALHDADPSTDRFGVFVSGVDFAGAPFKPAAAGLVGARVRWLPAGDSEQGPKFELRNTIIYNPGNNDGIFMPIIPFHILVEDSRSGIRIGRDDPLLPNDPEKQVWQIADSELYARRCPREFYSVADEALEAIGLSSPDDYPAYFQKRKEWLELELDQVEGQIARYPEEKSSDATLADFKIRRATYRNRLFVIESFTAAAVGNRLGTRLGMMCRWDFELTGPRVLLERADTLGGTVSPDPAKPWRVRFWMGSFDGDTLRGYMRGFLQVPFSPREMPPTR